jgi:uncharacterized protein (TIGR03083 family)
MNMANARQLTAIGTAAQGNAVDAGRIPALSHAEARQLAHEELERFLALVERLQPEDWERQTACTQWTVRDMLAHVTGACAGYATWGQFRRQYVQNPYLKEEAVAVDGINRRQVEDREQCGPADLIAELRVVGPKAIATRQRLPWLLRIIPIPFGPPLGTAPISYLTDTIYIRDMWMHRLDICRATGRPFDQDAKHDGRIVALVMRDLATNLFKRGDSSLVYALAGPAGGSYHVGNGTPQATIHMDVLDFNWLASGRTTGTQALTAGLVRIEGDREVGHIALTHTSVPY